MGAAAASFRGAALAIKNDAAAAVGQPRVASADLDLLVVGDAEPKRQERWVVEPQTTAITTAPRSCVVGSGGGGGGAAELLVGELEPTISAEELREANCAGDAEGGAEGSVVGGREAHGRHAPLDVLACGVATAALLLVGRSQQWQRCCWC